MSPPSSRELFLAWAARRREVVDLEDRLAALDAAAAAESAEMEARLRTAQAEAERVLAEALAAFHAELRERGLE